MNALRSIGKLVRPRCQGIRCMTNEAAEPVRRNQEYSINEVTLLGRVGDDPKYISDNKYLVFPVATYSRFRRDDQNGEIKTEWHNVIVFNQAVVDHYASTLVRGDRVLIQGRLASKTKPMVVGDEERYIKDVKVVADRLVNITKKKMNAPMEMESEAL